MWLLNNAMKVNFTDILNLFERLYFRVRVRVRVKFLSQKGELNCTSSTCLIKTLLCFILSLSSAPRGTSLSHRAHIEQHLLHDVANSRIHTHSPGMISLPGGLFAYRGLLQALIIKYVYAHM